MSEENSQQRATTVNGFEIRRTRRWPWIVGGALAVVALGAGVLGLNSRPASASFDSRLVVAFNEATPAGERVIEFVNEEIAPDYDIEIVARGFGESIPINVAVADHEIAGTINQHQWWMRDVNASQGLDLIATSEIYQWAFDVFSDVYDSLDEVEDGATVSIPDDPANQSQALWLLQREGLLTLDPEVEPRTAQLGDIAENPKNLQFDQIALPAQGRVYQEYDLTIAYPSYFIAHDALDARILSPEPPRTFAARLVISPDAEDDPNIQKLIQAFDDERIQDWLENVEDAVVKDVLLPLSPE